MKKREQVGLKHPKDAKGFMEYSNDINEIYECIKKYNAGKKQKVLIKFDNMIANIVIKKHHRTVTELVIKGRELNISLVFII